MKNRIAITLMILVVGGFAVAQGARLSTPRQRLAPPAKGERLRVAFVLSDDAVMIDFVGPWEIFRHVMIPSRGEKMDEQHVFEFYTVSDSRTLIHAADGMQIVPDYTFDDAPKPNIVVVPAQRGRSPKMLAWLRKRRDDSEVVMSICTGAFVLADAGLLDGKKATTHHDALDALQHDFPRIKVERGKRYVQSDPIVFTSAGLSAGIDLALHIVELYFGRQTAQATAETMEYEGKGWLEDYDAEKSSQAIETKSGPRNGMNFKEN